MAGKDRVSVIIFNHNGKHMLDGCIKSVLSQKYRGFKVFLLDNGSTDGSADYVRKKYPQIKIIRIEKNKKLNQLILIWIGESEKIRLLNIGRKKHIVLKSKY